MNNILATLIFKTVGIHDNARNSLRNAAQRWDCEYLEVQADDGDAPSHARLHLLDQLPSDTRVIYIDADLLVRSDCPNPLKVVPGDAFGYVPKGNKEIVSRDLEKNLRRWMGDDAVSKKVSIKQDYPDTGMLCFETTRHRPLFDAAIDIAERRGESHDDEISNGGPFCIGIATSGVPTFPLPDLFNHAPRPCRNKEAGAMQSTTVHLGSQADRAQIIPAVEWDDLGPSRSIPGSNRPRWQDGRPVSLSAGPELPFFIRQLSKVRGGRLVEIGTYLGGSAWWGAQIARSNRCEYWCIDTWAGACDLSVNDEIYAAFQLNMKDAGLDQKVRVIRKPSTAAAHGFADRSIDLIFIDGDHTEVGCGADIDAWWPKIKKGGVMMGHDYCPGYGVIDAVNRRFGKPEQVSEGGYPIWLVTKR